MITTVALSLVLSAGMAGGPGCSSSASNTASNHYSMTNASWSADKNIVETAVAAGSFKTLAAALEAAGLLEALQGSGPFTVFAPTDAAFAKLPAGTVENLLKPEIANHAMVVRHFYKGGYYPIGSSKTILQSIEPIIEQYGGAIKINHRVEEIILEGNTAVGVRGMQKKGKDFIPFEYYAPVIVSDAGAYNTYCKLLPKSAPVEAQRTDLIAHPNGLSHLCLYIGFKENPETLGFKGENHWIFDGYDHDELYSDLDAVTEDRMRMAFLSFPSLKDPESKAHTGEIITFISYDYFKKWSTERWKNRGEDYEAVKQEIAERMLNFIEGKYPGFKDLVDFYELSTPLTTEHFTLHRNGEIYGMHTTPDRLLKDWNQVKTPIKNLYLTGTDAAVLGVAGAFTGGVFASVELMGKSLGLLHYIKLENKAQAFAKELQAKGIRTVFDESNS